MSEQNLPKKWSALTKSMLASGIFAVSFAIAALGLNRAQRPEVAYSPIVGIGLAGAFLLAAIGITIWYLQRTDEHDRLANLWGATWGWIAAIVTPPIWFLLHKSALLPPINAMIVCAISAVVAMIGWTWMRFR